MIFPYRTVATIFICSLSITILYADLPLSNLSLQDAEEIAKDYNKQFLIAKEVTDQANERKLQAVSRWLPSLRYRAEFRDVERKELFFNVFNENMPFKLSHRGYSSILRLDQPIFSTDLIFNLKSKQIEAEAFSFEQASTLNELLFAVRKGYYSVVVLETALDIERENIDYLAFALEQEQKKLEAGNSTTLEVNQNKVAVSNAISLYYATLKDLKNARNAFVLTLGIDPLLEPQIILSEKKVPLESIPEIAVKLQEVQQKYRYFSKTIPSSKDYLLHIDMIENARSLLLFSEEEVLDYLELALSNRPDLLQSKLKVGVANQLVRAKEGLYLPKIDGYARYSYNDETIGGEPFGSQKYYWVGGLVLSWNLFDSLLREHEIREAKSVRKSSRISYDKTYQRVEVEIRNGLYQLEEAIMGYLSSSQSVFVAEQAREQAADKLSFGRIPPLEYRDSVNLWLQAKNQNNNASYDLISAYYQLRFSTGVDVSKNDYTQVNSKFGF